MIDISHRNIFIYDIDGGSYVVSNVLSFFDLMGLNIRQFTNHSDLGVLLANRSIIGEDFEESIKSNLFRLDYALLDVYPIQEYLDKIDFIDIPVIFLLPMNWGVLPVNLDQIPSDYNIYIFYKDRSEELTTASLFTPRFQKTYMVKDVRRNETHSVKTLKGIYIRDKKIDDILGSPED